MQTTEKQSLFPALRSRNYRLFFAGQGVSLIGTWMTQIATVWLVYHLTQSAFMLGIVGFTSQIPSFVLAPFGGAFVDRFPCYPTFSRLFRTKNIYHERMKVAETKFNRVNLK